MGLLDNVTDLISSAYDYITGNDEAGKAQAASKTKKAVPQKQKIANAKQTPNSIVRPKGETLGTVGDVVVKSKKTKASKTSKGTKVEAGNIQLKLKKNGKLNSVVALQTKIAQLENKCRQFGITKDAVINILVQMNFSYKEFLLKAPKEQMKILGYIEKSIDKLISDQKEGKVAKDINKTNLVGQTANNLKFAEEECEIKNAQKHIASIEKKLNDIKGKYQSAKTAEERANILNDVREGIIEEINNAFDILIQKATTKKEKQELELKRQNYIEFTQTQAAIYFAASADTKDRSNAVFLTDGKRYAQTTKLVIDLTAPEKQSEVAGTMNHKFQEFTQQFKYEHNDAIDAEQYGEAVQFVTQYMTAEDALQFAKDAYEFEQKVKNGEVEAPWMTKEHFDSEHNAISTGIEANKVMTEEQKTSVRSQVEELAAKYELTKPVSSETETKAETKSVRSAYVNIPAPSVAEKTEVKVSENQETETPVNYKATKKELEIALSVMSYDEVKQKYPMTQDREIAEAVLHNPNLKMHKTSIVSYLKACSADDLYDVTRGCSTEMFCFVLRNVSPAKAGKLYDLSSKNICYAARTLGEQIVEKGRKYDAA